MRSTEDAFLTMASSLCHNVIQPFAYLPNQIPDELLYSWIARVHALNSKNNPRETLHAFFGCSSVIPSADLPTRLGHFISNAGGAAVFLTVENVIRSSTAFPYFALFMSAEQRFRAIEAMTASGGKQLKIRMGLVANGFGASAALHSCADCDRASLAAYGCLIWSRSINLPGVFVCPIHGCELQRVGIQSYRANRHELLVRQISSSDKHSLTMTEDVKASLLSLALLSREALLCEEPAPEPDLRQRAYLIGLQRLGFVSGSRIKWGELAYRVQLQYADFAGMPCRQRLLSSSTQPMRWLRDLCQRPQRSIHPICHLLFIGTVFGSVSSMMRTVADLRDRTPSRFSKQRLSTSATIRRTESALELLYDIRLSCREVSAKLGISVTTAALRRRRLGITIAERRKSLTPSKQHEAERLLKAGVSIADIASKVQISIAQVYRLLASSFQLKCSRATVLMEHKVLMRREAWLSLLQHDKQLSMAAMRVKAPATYTWLYRNDKDWLLAERGISKRTPQSEFKGRIDWVARDCELATMVRTAFSSAPKGLTEGRRSVTRLLRTIGKGDNLRRNLGRLPQLCQQLLLSSETHEQFRERRYVSAHEELRNLGYDKPADWRVFRLARLRPNHK